MHDGYRKFASGTETVMNGGTLLYDTWYSLPQQVVVSVVVGVLEYIPPCIACLVGFYVAGWLAALHPPCFPLPPFFSIPSYL